MLKARRPLGRLFHWFVLVAVLGLMPQVRAAGPGTTTVVDVIYRADGTPAQGTLLITWPSFATKQGEAVASGTKSVKIGVGGSVRIPLAPNTGALPSGTHYKVTLKLDDGTTDTEYWVVPDSGETSIAAIRSKVVPATMAAQFVTRDYIDSTLSGVSGAMVVHKSGDESVAGVKTFVVSPVVPSPSSDQQAVNKAYVDAATRNAGSGVVLKTNGANNSSQAMLDLKAGSNVSLVDSGAGAITINSTGGIGPQGPAGGPFSGVVQVDGSTIANIQAGILAAGTTSILIPSDYAGKDSFTNPNNRPLLDMRNMGESRGGAVSVKDFGADGRGGVHDGTATAGSKVISYFDFASFMATYPGYLGSLPAIGMQFRMAAAGVAGADLVSTITAVGASTITLADAAGATVTRGSIWGYRIDNSGAFQAAVTYCQTTGCTIKVPQGVYGMYSTVTAPVGPNIGRFAFDCEGGRQATKVVWTGAGMGAIFRAPAASAPLAVRGCMLKTFDATAARLGIGIEWLGGVEHEATDNYFGDLYEGIRASTTWLNKIDFNRFYGCTSNAAVHFGPPGVGPVNGTTVSNNEFGCYGTYGLLNDSNGSGGSGGNTYSGNSFEGTTATTISDILLTEGNSTFKAGYSETGGSAVPAYKALVLAMGNSVISGPNIIGTGARIAGSDNLITSPTAGSVEDIGGRNVYVGPITVTGAGAATAVVHGGYQTPLTMPGLKVISDDLGVRGWAYGRVDIAGTPFGTSAPMGTNPTNPADFTSAAAIIPQGSIIINRGAQRGITGNGAWLCGNTTCSMNPPNPSEWYRMWEVSQKVRSEGTAAPTSGAWTVGDFFWNTNPTGASPTIGWVNTVAGTPGTWVAVTVGSGGGGGGSTFNPDLTITDGTLTGKLKMDSANGLTLYSTYANGTGILVTNHSWIATDNTGALQDNYTDVGQGGYRMRTGYFGTKVKVPTLELTTKASYTCDSTTRGQFNYIAGGAGVKDVVQVCGKDVADAYAWRTIY